MDGLEGWKRTATCGDLGRQDSGKEVILMGWVHRRRDHGGLIFVDLRDRYGITQIVFDPQHANDTYVRAKELRGEYVVAVKGQVQLRPEGMINPNLSTGEIEVSVRELKILNPAKTPPIGVAENVEVSEELRLKYRYLDLRSPQMQKSLIIRHKTYQAVRSFFDAHNFIEVETPYLMRSTPEGARDYLVPSRIHKGKFYALPQSPQTYKQVLMIAGLDRYYQIVRCFRDEDLRADRQPEFTQIDVEMSFVELNDVLQLNEELMVQIFKKVLNLDIDTPFPRLTYAEAMARFGSDKPDLRFDLEITEITDCVKECEFKVFTETVKAGGIVCGVLLKNGAGLSRKRIDTLTHSMLELGAKGLIAIKVSEDGWESSLTKFFTPAAIQQINTAFDAKPGDLLLLIADERNKALTLAGTLRQKLAEEEKLIPQGIYKHVWIVDFPLLEFDREENRYVARHHPFTSPLDEDLQLLEQEPQRARAKAYDLVLNGYEIAGGSIRIHTRELQDKIFRLLGLSKAEAEDKFGFLLNAFEFGAPPHGGIAFGFDRLVMILANKKSLREVIAFPKTNSALSLMDGAPSEVTEEQLQELNLKTV
ncbi:MAG: aspartate--tRNA ligase [bacterium]